jgi:hypothetical protein
LALTLPRPDHLVIVMEENHGYTQIIGSPYAPYINTLAQEGALFTQSYALSHPSQPNYLQLYSGSNQGVTTDNCPYTFSAPNLGQQLGAHGFSFGGYSETMPMVGYTGCSYSAYARKHNPWVNFTNVPSADNMPLDGYFPTDYSTLPTVSFVIPNQNDDMHNGSDPGTIQTGDAWLKSHLDAYVQWTIAHNSLLMVTFDEDNGSQGNHIATVFVGPMVVPGPYGETINHYNVLRTVEDMYGLGKVGATRRFAPITDVWTPPPSPPGVVGTRAALGTAGTPVPGPTTGLVPAAGARSNPPPASVSSTAPNEDPGTQINRTGGISSRSLPHPEATGSVSDLLPDDLALAWGR